MHSRTSSKKLTAILLSGSALASVLGWPVSSAHAACSLVPTAGNDVFICDSGTHGGNLVDLSGDNSLTMPAGGTGIINGDVTFGPGVDTVEVHSGAINGQLQQGDGIDDFIMTGGQIDSLNQGGHFDTFFMSDGHIVNYFDDGDEAVMTGGRIGRVDMKLANNIFDMSGGTIDGNLVAGFGHDTIILSGGSIGGNISVSGGTDRVTITGGSVGGDIRLSVGSDTLLWDGGGSIGGDVDMGGDDDTATLRNLNDTNLAGMNAFLGGLGTDDLTLEGVVTDTPDRFQTLETVNVNAASALTFAGGETLTLGDSGTGTGTVNIDASSTLFGGSANGGINAFGAGQRANVRNAGTIDLTNGGDSATDTFTITGDYHGDDGKLSLNTVLGDDTSSSDKLVIAEGSAGGSTGISIVNAGGSGGATVQDGIMVVEATGSGTTAAGAFSLNDRVAVGAFEYQLYRGGVSAGTQENWYLRSTIVNPTSPTVPQPAPGPVTPPTPGATPVTGGTVALYRPEVAAYSAVPPALQHLAASTLGTFHERRGAQPFLRDGDAVLPASWGRFFGQNVESNWDGTVAPGFDGSLFGFQLGQDLIERDSGNGHVDRAGIFLSHARLNGDTTGQAVGWNDMAVGELDLHGTSLGGYWTHVAPDGWYLDGVVMGTWFGGETRSSAGEAIDVDGAGIAASVETGYPVAINDRWNLEPQAQLIWQHLSLDNQSDRFSTVTFETNDVVTGRLGMRFEGDFQTEGGRGLKPYFKANLWHTFSADQNLHFDGDAITTELEGTSLELGAGLVANLTKQVGLFATADYTTNIGGEKKEIFEGNLGLSITW
ncbi:autotransporter outer membrane beta-barrel domain-containing protein [Nitratireductor kimnyeongensis]|uniref:Autotransporter outer membrane beta-barrel domain-containing protein n=1 Tax=Nitratireductor kimnyeongensis TaxID=430679 RepID=A0ABW0T950_9HYPH|nr:autotransporter outer membrane beta-barrel domain-containing protein [Nitratireductor kimnyeongensis]QZZ35816.1 autotransporter outer membrane beta-barrel domain-containing protein [Nitratireductor kimnyeongensis]